MGFFSDVVTGVKQKLGMEPLFKSPVPMSEDLSTYPGQANESWRQALDKIDRPQLYPTKPIPKATVKTQPPVKSSPQKFFAPRQAVAAASTNNVAGRLQSGLQKYSPNVPIASMSAQLAQAGQGLPDPYLPALVAMIETSGGRNVTRGQNNIYNLLPPPDYRVDYPDLQTAILGGGDKKGFAGTIRNGAYDKYLKSGNLADFLQVYTPPGAEHGNASMERQLHRYADLRKYFE